MPGNPHSALSLASALGYGVPAPIDHSQLIHLGNASASPQMEGFTGAQAAQSMCYWLRSVNTRGEKSFWSEHITAPIAG